ncbi:GntR family transcriptional regulator [Cystobacter fuscus]|uniref:GntR family transcriptional regulator n=1 Tax=Cystobacter fuscus TaxID=43 RepID=A0A250J0A5_9BACT|nr:hypothetical protein [Cystobacter fuscus]ATB36841.1 GntR family transcriptional regulator [Cystobacter fuscus]
MTPSSQFPLGVTLSHRRRLALLRWAERSNAWVFEDDYDSEYRYVGRPLASLQGLTPDARVIYTGTFSFITEGHFGRHVRRMRTLYAERQALLVEEARRELAGLIELHPADTGMHLTGWLPPGMDDRTASARAASAGIHVSPLSAFREVALVRGGPPH